MRPQVFRLELYLENRQKQQSRCIAGTGQVDFGKLDLNKRRINHISHNVSLSTLLSKCGRHVISSIQNGCGSGRSVASTNLSKIKLVIVVLLGYRVWFDLTVTSLPFLKLKCCFGHVRFPRSLSEANGLLDKVKDLISPCVIRIKCSVVFR